MDAGTESITLREGQVWQERDKRFVRYVKIIMLLRPAALRVQTCDYEGNKVKGSRESQVDEARFLKAFTLVHG